MTPATIPHATALATSQLHTFPLIENGKTPAIGGWQQRSTTNPDEIRKMWKKNYNIGVHTKGLLVLDVDVKNGKPGMDSLAMLKDLYDLPDTMTVKTASGGLHLYFRTSSPVPNSAGRIGPGLDVRGDWGYVVGPGSIIDSKAYTLEGGTIQPAPQWLIDMAGKPKERTAKGEKVIDLLDTKPAIDRATKYLQSAPPAIEGSNGDETTYRTACKVKDFGVSELTAIELMDEHYNPRCSPPWDFEQLALKVNNAYHYGNNPIGSAAPEADFDPFEPPREPKQKLYAIAASEIAPRLSEPALIKGWLGEEAMSVLYGESNVGKSFVAMSMGFCVALGQPWAGKKTTQGVVVYVAAEAGLSSINRIAALKKHWHEDNAPFFLVPCPVDLLRPGGDTKELAALVTEIQAAHGKVRLVVVDTLSRAIAGGNENSPDDMGALVKHLDALRSATKAHLMVVHHSGKDKAKGARGHSLLRAATDTEIEVADGSVRATKQRDMEQAPPVGFGLEVVDLGLGAEGDGVTSCVAVPIDEAVDDFGGDPSEMACVVDALNIAVKENNNRPVSMEKWAESCRMLVEEAEAFGGEKMQLYHQILAVTGGARKMRLSRARNKASQKGLVKKNTKNQWVTV